MTQYNAPRVEALSTIFKRLSHLTSNLARNLDFLPPSTSIKVCENKHGPQSPCYLFVTSDDADDLVTVQEYLALRNVGRLDCCRWNGYNWVNDNLTSLLPGNTMFVLHTYVWVEVSLTVRYMCALRQKRITHKHASYHRSFTWFYLVSNQIARPVKKYFIDAYCAYKGGTDVALSYTSNNEGGP